MEQADDCSSCVAYLGLGSNEGARLGHLQRALKKLDGVSGIEVVAASSVYQTEPVGEVPDQRDFFNATLKVETTLEPLELLQCCKEIEKELGRAEGTRHGPRPIDIDVLLMDDTVGTFSDEGATHECGAIDLPHPTLLERRFVLQTLLDLDSGLRHPDGTDLRAALEALGTAQRAQKVGDLAL